MRDHAILGTISCEKQDNYYINDTFNFCSARDVLILVNVYRQYVLAPISNSTVVCS